MAVLSVRLVSRTPLAVLRRSSHGARQRQDGDSGSGGQGASDRAPLSRPRKGRARYKAGCPYFLS